MIRPVLNIAIAFAASLSCSYNHAQSFFSKPVDVTLQVLNRSGDDAIVKMTASKADGKIEFAKDKIVPNGQTSTWLEKLSPGSKLNWSYTLPTLSASIDLPARTIADNSSQEIVEILSALQRYDDKSALSKLKQIASQLDLDKNPIQLKKAQELMGSFWIGDENGKQVGAGWSVKDVEISSDGTIRFEDSVSIEGNSALAASANIPLLAQMQAGFESGQIYKMRWAAEHFTFRNSGMDNQLPMLKLADLKQILASLKANSSSKLCYVGQARVLKFVAHSVTKGTKIAFNASMAKSTIFTSTGSYIFDASEASMSALTDQVVKIEPTCLQRDQTTAFIEYRINTLEKPADPIPQPKP